MSEKNSANSVPATTKNPPESIYGVEQLIASAAALNAPREIVAVALRRGGKTHYTLKEAQDLVDKLKNKEVK